MTTRISIISATIITAALLVPTFALACHTPLPPAPSVLNDLNATFTRFTR